MFSTFSSGRGRTGCRGSSTTSGKRADERGKTELGEGEAELGEGETELDAPSGPDEPGGAEAEAPDALARGLSAVPLAGTAAPQPSNTNKTASVELAVIGLRTEKRIPESYPISSWNRFGLSLPAAVAEVKVMRHVRGSMPSTLLLGCAIALLSCNEHSVGSTPAPAKLETPKRTVPSVASAQSRPSATQEQPAPDSLSLSEIRDESPAPADSGHAEPSPSKLVIDQAQEIGPAGQMTATNRGVIMIDRSDGVQLAKLGPLSRAARPDRAKFTRAKGGPNDFFAVARGPLVLRGKAYWVRDGKLVRRSLDDATPIEILANDARNGTRVAGVELEGAPAHAVYISNPLLPDEAPRARLWTEGGGVVTVSPEGAGASSISAASSGQDLFLVGIDARSAMTPMHGRLVRFKGGKPELDPDVVMWVGSTSQTLSEVFTATTPFGVRAFLPIERDTSHFGLVMLELGHAPHMDPRTVYRGYPNGIDVAPAAGAAFCGVAFVVYARPESPNPDSDQVLEIAEITASGLGRAERIDSARGFANISLAAATNSAVLAYVADFRTYATTLRCAHEK